MKKKNGGSWGGEEKPTIAMKSYVLLCIIVRVGSFMHIFFKGFITYVQSLQSVPFWGHTTTNNKNKGKILHVPYLLCFIPK